MSFLVAFPVTAFGCARASHRETARAQALETTGGSIKGEEARARDASVSGVDGPHEHLALATGRSIYYALPAGSEAPYRLIGHLHGVCGGPSYACGKWLGAAVRVGGLVCPTGNARCGDSSYGPPSWEAPSWAELVATMDHDLEQSIQAVEKKRPGIFQREGAILTGYSRGAYAAPVIARRHPGRWPYLILIEANVPLSASGLRAAKVEAVALVAGEQGTEISGMRRSQAALEAEGFRARVFVMRRTGHLYSDDVDDVMKEALAFVLEEKTVSPP
jgi:hypothetical protein